MDCEFEIKVALACTFVAAACSILEKNASRSKKHFGKRFLFRERGEKGAYHSLMPQLRRDPEMHFIHFQMSAERLEKLLGMIAPKLQKCSWNTPLSPGERLCLTLRYLAHGMSMTALTFEYRVSKSTISSVIREVCQVIWQELMPLYISAPQPEDWQHIAAEMMNKWDIPNCVGAIDGKHVRIKAPENSGSQFFNYKSYFSMVLLATCDVNRCFTSIDVGCQGRISDGGVVNASVLGRRLRSRTLNLPVPAEIPSSGCQCEFFFVADDAFPLLNNIMRPYPGTRLSHDKLVYNYHLSRARIIENAFGILAACWRILHTPIHASTASIEAIVKATCSLHNFIMKEDQQCAISSCQYCPPGFADLEWNGQNILGEWRNHVSGNGAMQPMCRSSSNNYSRSAHDARVILTTYFNFWEGALQWQDDYVTRG